MTTTIRQNPTPAVKSPGGEQCPAHGWYPTDPDVYRLRDQAIGGRGVPAEKARRLLAEAAQLRLRCPDCGGRRPTPLEHATSIRNRAIAGGVHA